MAQINCNWINYLNGLNKKTRHEIRRKQKKIEKEYNDVRVLKYKKINEVEEFLNNVSLVSEKSWQKKRIGSREIDEESASVLRYLKKLAKHNMFSGYILFVDNKPIAYAFGIYYRKYLHLKEISYDLEYQKNSHLV